MEKVATKKNKKPKNKKSKNFEDLIVQTFQEKGLVGLDKLIPEFN